MKKLCKGLSLILFCTLITSCASDWMNKKTIKGNRETITQTREISPDFKQLSTASMIDIVIIPEENDGTVKLKGESNILEYIKTEVKDGSLHIEFKDNYNISSHGKLEVSVKSNQIENILSSGSGDIKTDGTLKIPALTIKKTGSGDMDLALDVEKLKINTSGSGDFKLKGKAEDFEIDKTGSGDLYAFDFQVNNADINSTGSGDANLNISQKLKFKSTGSGDVKYKGDPTVDSQITGSGSLKKID